MVSIWEGRGFSALRRIPAKNQGNMGFLLKPLSTIDQGIRGRNLIQQQKLLN